MEPVWIKLLFFKSKACQNRGSVFQAWSMLEYSFPCSTHYHGFYHSSCYLFSSFNFISSSPLPTQSSMDWCNMNSQPDFGMWSDEFRFTLGWPSHLTGHQLLKTQSLVTAEIFLFFFFFLSVFGAAAEDFIISQLFADQTQRHLHHQATACRSKLDTYIIRRLLVD